MEKIEVLEFEKTQIELPTCMDTALKQLNDVARGKIAALQSEENASKVANLQGYLAGVRAYKQALRNAGFVFSVKLDGTDVSESVFFDEDGCTLDIDGLRVIVYDINRFENTPEYEEFKEQWEESVNKQKDWLFYGSEKGRDLHFVKGWYSAMCEIDDRNNRLRNELKAAEKKVAESLPFDGE